MSNKQAWLVNEYDEPLSAPTPLTTAAMIDEIEDRALEYAKKHRVIVGIAIEGFGVYRYLSANGLSTTLFVYDCFAPRFIDDLVQEQEIHSFRLKEIWQ